MDPATLRIGLAGLGTVGTGVLRLLAENGALVDRRAGRPIRVVAVSARDRSRDRGVDLSAFPWRDDPAAMIDEVDVVVEMIGGADGPALALTGAALAHGRAVVTANKAMIAHHGLVLAEQAERADVPFKYEAAVAGGIPVIKAIREGASANRLTAVLGILNGTCNHILTTMEATGRAQADVLAEAQALGLAEADPATDIGGADAAHKLAILSALCFGTRLDLAAVTVAGIGGVSATDIAEARALGHRVRLVGRAEWAGGRLAQSVGPVLVPDAHPLAHVLGCQNAIVAEGNYVGRLFFEGAGAGAGPTASAIVADLIDIARDEYGPPFAMPVAALEAAAIADPDARCEKTYLRFVVADRPGVLAEIAAAMRDAGVSIESFIQRSPSTAEGATMVLVTHECEAGQVADALRRLKGSESLRAEPMRMPILGAG